MALREEMLLDFGIIIIVYWKVDINSQIFGKDLDATFGGIYPGKFTVEELKRGSPWHARVLATKITVKEDGTTKV